MNKLRIFKVLKIGVSKLNTRIVGVHFRQASTNVGIRKVLVLGVVSLFISLDEKACKMWMMAHLFIQKCMHSFKMSIIILKFYSNSMISFIQKAIIFYQILF